MNDCILDALGISSSEEDIIDELINKYRDYKEISGFFEKIIADPRLNETTRMVIVFIVGRMDGHNRASHAALISQHELVHHIAELFLEAGEDCPEIIYKVMKKALERINYAVRTEETRSSH